MTLMTDFLRVEIDASVKERIIILACTLLKVTDDDSTNANVLADALVIAAIDPSVRLTTLVMTLLVVALVDSETLMDDLRANLLTLTTDVSATANIFANDFAYVAVEDSDTDLVAVMTLDNLAEVVSAREKDLIAFAILDKLEIDDSVTDLDTLIIFETTTVLDSATLNDRATLSPFEKTRDGVSATLKVRNACNILEMLDTEDSATRNADLATTDVRNTLDDSAMENDLVYEKDLAMVETEDSDSENILDADSTRLKVKLDASDTANILNDDNSLFNVGVDISDTINDLSADRIFAKVALDASAYENILAVVFTAARELDSATEFDIVVMNR
jgi:hypothetical protein